jgi:Protein of unknown function (DUF1232)
MVRVLLIAGGLVVVSWAVLVMLACRLPPGAAKDVATVLPACVTTVKRLRRDRRVPRRAKPVVALVGLCVLSPVDLMSEFIPVIGPRDDVLVVAPPSATPPGRFHARCSSRRGLPSRASASG